MQINTAWNSFEPPRLWGTPPLSLQYNPHLSAKSGDVGAIATRLEAIASRLEAIAFSLSLALEHGHRRKPLVQLPTFRFQLLLTLLSTAADGV